MKSIFRCSPFNRYHFSYLLGDTDARKLVGFTYPLYLFPLEVFPLFKRMNDVQISYFDSSISVRKLKSSCDVIKRKKYPALNMFKVRIQCDKIIRR